MIKETEFNEMWKLDEDTTPDVAKVPFEIGTQEIWKIRIQQISNGIRSYNFGANISTSNFATKLFPLLVYDINRLEGTFAGYNDSEKEGPTLLKIKSYFDVNCQAPIIVNWNSEGGRKFPTSSDRQLYQCAHAVKYLLLENVNAELSLNLIVETHKIMMENSYSIDQRVQIPTGVGNVRTIEEVNAGMYQFIPAQDVRRCMIALIHDYNRLFHEITNPIDLATYLFYQMITIHPFTNGNGRLCRLFLAWSLMKCGFPFPISFSSGHSKRR